MGKSIVTLAAALSILPVIVAAPASAQTQGQTYAFGRADFCRGHAEARRAVRLWLTGPDMYEFIYGSPSLPRPLVIDCGPSPYRHDHRALTR
jgi:UDP:flavonoid glycosyltransferase YjiC (YdhE family)